ncbi:p21-C-terminal region-binding family protein [Candida albicans]|uniref:Protein BCP1 n=1 Tax=Candida albicans TaxID=5476 RepID=A0A8H6BYY9_CANAX|nr:p21-C-terminal region-binding family protein [Candida albicans]
MGKRRVDEESDSDIDVSSTDSETELESTQQQQQQQEGATTIQETVDVDFDFFDLNPQIDFHATKNFLRQLFGDDNGEFNLSEIADLILRENSVGTSIKTEGMESDPFAILSVINLTNNLNVAVIKQLIEYILNKTKSKTEFNIILKKLLTNQNDTTRDRKFKTGLIISERFINMPVEVIPPMYKMLLQEMEKAEDAHENYEFDYFLIISRVYQLVDPVEREDEDHEKESNQMDYFHLEDQILELNTQFKGIFEYNNENKQETDSRRVFTEYGIDPKLSLILIDKDNLAKSVIEMEQQFPPP